jgi:glyoxylase-like metal-dependent hydrolase (beta-lactamase superfamily II)
MVRFWLLDTGYCTASEHHLMRGGEHKTIKTHALVVLIEHPQAGWILFDTGYAPRVLEAFKTFPFQLYGALTPVTTRSGWSVLTQIAKMGLQPKDISTVIVSHFHADHIAGLRDFATSSLIASGEAFSDVRGKSGLAALRRAFVPKLMPDSLERFVLIEGFDSPALGPFGATHDMFNDGSLRLLRLPGHARGQLGLLAQTTIGPVLFAADGAWLSAAVRENRPPPALALRLVGDPRVTVETIRKLHEFGQAHPDVWIVPSHCPEVAALITRGQPRAFSGRADLGQASKDPI